MGVLMADRSLGVIHRTVGAMDAHGDAAVTDVGTLLGPWPGRARQEQDGTWTLAVDAQAWPLAQRDIVKEPATGAEWVVTDSTLLRNTLDPVVDYVRVTGLLREGTDTTTAHTPAGQVGPA